MGSWDINIAGWKDIFETTEGVEFMEAQCDLPQDNLECRMIGTIAFSFSPQ